MDFPTTGCNWFSVSAAQWKWAVVKAAKAAKGAKHFSKCWFVLYGSFLSTMQSIRHYPGLTDMQFAGRHGGKQINGSTSKVQVIPGLLCRKKHRKRKTTWTTYSAHTKNKKTRKENMYFWVPGRQTINGIGVNLLMPLSKPCALAGGKGLSAGAASSWTPKKRG